MASSPAESQKPLPSQEASAAPVAPALPVSASEAPSPAKKESEASATETMKESTVPATTGAKNIISVTGTIIKPYTKNGIYNLNLFNGIPYNENNIDKSYIIFQDIDNISNYYANVTNDNYKIITNTSKIKFNLREYNKNLSFEREDVDILKQINDNIIKKNKYIIEINNKNKLYTIYNNKDDVIAIIAEFNNEGKRIFIIQAKANILKETLKLELVLFKDYFITNNLEYIYDKIFGINNLFKI